jgi:hypothetical protein
LASLLAAVRQPAVIAMTSRTTTVEQFVDT